MTADPLHGGQVSGLMRVLSVMISFVNKTKHGQSRFHGKPGMTVLLFVGF